MERSALSVAILRQRLMSLLSAMPAAQSGDETSVHQARVASRRLRGALPMLNARVDAEALSRVDRRVRKITRALGPVRELDVSLLLLTELEGRGAVPPAAIARVREAVAAERVKRRQEMLDAITPSRLEKLRKRLVDAVAPTSPPLAAGSTLAEAASQARKRAKRLRAAIERAGGIYLSERLHRVRIEAKKLRYALEIQRELTHSRSRAHLNRLKVQQDLLGRMHDLEMLIDQTRAVQASLPGRSRQATTELDALIRVLEDECREGHAAYMRGRTALLKLCAAVTEAAEQFRSSAA
jgi:CHAD domain-containing protein